MNEQERVEHDVVPGPGEKLVEVEVRTLRGFAALQPERRREIAASGGRTAHQRGTAHCWDSAEAAEAGRKGGEKTSADREHMRELGRRGGAAVSADREHMRTIGRRGGQAVSKDSEHMREIGGGGGRANGDVS